MAKHGKPKNSGIKWPKTKAAQIKDLQRQGHAVKALAEFGTVITAAQSIPNGRARKLLADAAAAAVNPIGINQPTVAGEKRSWQKHADKYFTENKAWDEVNGIYAACMDLLSTSLALLPLVKCDQLLTLVRQKRLLTRNIHAIVRDTTKLVEELKVIHEKHSNRLGGSENQGDLMQACDAFSAYVAFMDRYDSALMPLVVHASEQLQEALLVLKDIAPELYEELNSQLMKALNQIRGIVQEVTGGTTFTPAEAPAQLAA